jgi:nucleotide-binding universal stress UspA family protein
MFKKILFAYDGSEHSKRGAKAVGFVARMQANTEVWLACVMAETPKYLKEPQFQEYLDEQKKAAKNNFTKARSLIGEDVIIHDELLFGNPAENILKLANHKKCDLIVMGARGLSLLEGLLLGSQVHKVISHSNIPVLVVR